MGRGRNGRWSPPLHTLLNPLPTVTWVSAFSALCSASCSLCSSSCICSTGDTEDMWVRCLSLLCTCHQGNTSIAQTLPKARLEPPISSGLKGVWVTLGSHTLNHGRGRAHGAVSCWGSRSLLPLPCARFPGRVSSKAVTLLDAPPPQSQSPSSLLSLRPPSLNPGSQTVPCHCSPVCLAWSCHHVIIENVPSHLGIAP